MRTAPSNTPQARRAHRAFGMAVMRGQLQYPDACEKCGRVTRGIHGHHDDYSKPLDVRWLCIFCHHSYHGAERARANAGPALPRKRKRT